MNNNNENKKHYKFDNYSDQTVKFAKFGPVVDNYEFYFNQKIIFCCKEKGAFNEEEKYWTNAGCYIGISNISIPRQGYIFNKKYTNLFNCVTQNQKSEFYDTTHFFLHPGKVNSLEVDDSFKWLLTTSKNNLYIWNLNRELNSSNKIFYDKSNPSEEPNFSYNDNSNIIFSTWLPFHKDNHNILIHTDDGILKLFRLNDILNSKLIFDGNDNINIKECLNEHIEPNVQINVEENYGAYTFNKGIEDLLFLANYKIIFIDLRSDDHTTYKSTSFINTIDNNQYDYNNDIVHLEIDKSGIIIHSYNNMILFYNFKYSKEKEIFKLEFNSNVIKLKIIKEKDNLLGVLLKDRFLIIDYLNFKEIDEDMICYCEDFSNYSIYDFDINRYQNGSLVINGKNNNENCLHGGFLSVFRPEHIF